MRSAIILNAKAIVSSKGQIVIPRQFREVLGIHAGSELIFELHEEGTLELKPAKRSIEMFLGRCKREREPALPIKEIDRAIAEAVIENNRSKKGKLNDRR